MSIQKTIVWKVIKVRFDSVKAKEYMANGYEPFAVDEDGNLYLKTWA